MILVKYVITLPAGNTIQSMLETAPDISTKMKTLGGQVDYIENCEASWDHDPVENTFTTLYRWTDQQSIDDYYSWANSTVGNYDAVISEFTALINSIGGSLVRTTEEI